MVTSLVGAVFLVVLALRMRSSGSQEIAALGLPSAVRLSRRVAVVLIAGVLLLGLVVVGMLLGDWWLRLGDVVLWLQGESARAIELALNFRLHVWPPPCWPERCWQSPAGWCRR